MALRCVALVAASLAAASLSAAPTAQAYTQWSAAVTLGVGATLTPEPQREVLWSLGLRADVLFGPRSPFFTHAGPFVSLRTDDFDSLSAALGASLELPVDPTFPLVLSLGAATEFLRGPIAPTTVGAFGRLWWGSRSLNYHSSYGMAVGLWLEARYFPGDQRADLIAGLDADLGFITLPFVMLYEWIRR